MVPTTAILTGFFQQKNIYIKTVVQLIATKVYRATFRKSLKKKSDQNDK